MRLVSGLLTAAMVFTFLPISPFAAAEVYVPLNIYTFPDETFREYIGNTFDKDDDGILDTGEREAVTEIYVSKGYNGKKIKDLTGIQWFTNLKTLWCHDNQLTNLDVTQNTELQDLYCGMNQLTSLDVSQNTALKNLVFFKNQLTSLDVGNNKKLEILNCTQNNLTSLDVSQNSALEQLYCDQNNLTSMQVDNCTNLGRFRCDNNKSSVQVYESTRVLDPSTLPGNFDISRVRNLTGATKNADGTLTVQSGGGQVTYEYRCYGSTYETFTLNVTVIPEGIRIYGDNFPNYEFRQYLKANIDKDGDGYLNDTELNIRELDVSGQYIANLKGIEFFPNLEKLYCYNNKLTSLDVSKNPELKELQCYGNKLTSLNVSENTVLETLYCFNNQLTELDVSKNTALKELGCAENKLTSLDVSKNTALQWLSCYNNKLTSLDVTQNTALKELSCYDNQLTSLDVSKTAVTTLNASGNKITIKVETTSRTFNLSTLPGFDVTKVTNWNGGTVDGSTLTVNEGVNQVTYTYDCGNGLSETFTLNVNVVPDSTVTPPSGGDGTGTTTPPSGGDGTGTTTPPSGGGTGTTTPPSGGGTGTTTPPSGGDGTGTTTPPSGGGTGTTTPPSGGGTGTTTPPSGGGTGTTTPPSGGGTGTTTPPSGGGTGTTTPPSGGGTGTTTPPSGGGTGTTTPPSGGDGTGTTTPPSGGGTGTTTPPSGGGTGTTTPPSGGGGGGAGLAVLAVGGTALVGLAGYGIYSYVSEQQLKAILPEGVAVPENRAQTALLLWNTAGRPEPAAAPAFADVADPDTAKAAQWCVEQNLLQTRRDGAFAPDSTLPAYKTLNAYRQLTGK